MKRERGFTILEIAVVIVVGGILIGASVGIYQKFMKIHRRQQGVILVEEELNSIQISLGRLLTTLPGRELSFFSGEDFSAAELPIGGSVQIGIATPIKVGGNDAISIVYALRNAPRMELIEQTVDAAGKGIARAASPGISSPEELKLKPGDLMMLIGVGPSKSGRNPKPVARLVRLLEEPLLVKRGFPRRDAFEFSFDFCNSGACSEQLPYLTNATAQKIFVAGSAFVPINAVNIYLAKEEGRSRVIRNDGGSLRAVSSGNEFQIEGGINSSLGEADGMKIGYRLENGGELPTPDAPGVDWLGRIMAVNVKLSKSVRLAAANETAARTVSESFSIVIRNLD